MMMADSFSSPSSLWIFAPQAKSTLGVAKLTLAIQGLKMSRKKCSYFKKNYKVKV